MRRILGLVVATFVALACGSNNDGPPAENGNKNPKGNFGPGNDGGPDDKASCAATTANTEKAKVDIIFVIDNSGSMGGEIAQVKANVNNFASKIGNAGLDYRVFVISSRGTTTLYICVPPPLAGADCADNPPTFFHVDEGVASSNSLELILSTYDGKNSPLHWRDHLRFEATKVFIEVTDDESDLSAAKFDAQLLAKQPAGMFGTADERKYIFHGIISKPAGDAIPSSNVCKGAAGPSLDYQELAKLTGGLVDEVCKTDYSAVLDNISKGILDKLGCQLTYPTAEAADPTKLVVQFTPQGQASQKLTQVTDVSKCASVANAWYYDEPGKPTKIILCPSMCTTANSATGAKLEALVGCKAPGPS